MPLCRCKGKRCMCRFAGGPSIIVTGNGSPRNPYSAEFDGFTLEGVDNGQAVVTVTGSGAPGEPFVVSVEVEQSIRRDTFLGGSSTWTKPPTGTVAQVIVIGGGGGGGRPADGNQARGGFGGRGGSTSTLWTPLDALPDEVPVSVGQGGLGALFPSGVGGAGGGSWFGDYLFARGGAGGGNGASSALDTRLDGTPPEGGAGGVGGGIGEAENLTDRAGASGGGRGKGVSALGSVAGQQVVGWSYGGLGGNGGGYAGDLDPDNPNGRNGRPYGGGGGGAGINDPGTPQAVVGIGGNGAGGVVIVTVW